MADVDRHPSFVRIHLRIDEVSGFMGWHSWMPAVDVIDVLFAGSSGPGAGLAFDYVLASSAPGSRYVEPHESVVLAVGLGEGSNKLRNNLDPSQNQGTP
jgi:hypothetical protein